METYWIQRYGPDGAAWAKLRFSEQLVELYRRQGTYERLNDGQLA